MGEKRAWALASGRFSVVSRTLSCFSTTRLKQEPSILSCAFLCS